MLCGSTEDWFSLSIFKWSNGGPPEQVNLGQGNKMWEDGKRIEWVAKGRTGMGRLGPGWGRGRYGMQESWSPT